MGFGISIHPDSVYAQYLENWAGNHHNGDVHRFVSAASQHIGLNTGNIALFGQFGPDREPTRASQADVRHFVRDGMKSAGTVSPSAFAV
jgi:hypothetical protein